MSGPTQTDTFTAATDGAAALGTTPIGTPCSVCNGNWVRIRYEYEDGTGVPGAGYIVQRPAGGQPTGEILAEGVTDDQGNADVPLPDGIGEVEFYFHNDPEGTPYEDPEATRPLEEPEPGFWERLWTSISNAADWVWGVLQGDFDEDPTTSQIIARMILTMIPGIDQLADVQDIIACLYRLIWKQEYDVPMNWVMLLITLIGFIPVLGSLAKGILKLMIRRLDDLPGLYGVFNFFRKGNAHRWLRDFARDLTGPHLQEAIRLLTEMIMRIAHYLDQAKGLFSFAFNRVIDEAKVKLLAFAGVFPGKLREAAEWLQARILRTLAVGMSRIQRRPTRNTTPHVERQGVETPPTGPISNARRIDDLVEGGTVRSADEVNASFPAGYEPPYTPGTQVREFAADGEVQFVRVYGENSPRGGWVMRESDIQGLTPAQIQDRYALPAMPTHVIDVTPPAGTPMRTGTVNPLFGGSGGAQQFEFLERVNDGWGVGRPLE